MGGADLFLFSTSSTSSSVENGPRTESTRFLMMSSAQSTSSRPPTTTARRDAFTCPGKQAGREAGRQGEMDGGYERDTHIMAIRLV